MLMESVSKKTTLFENIGPLLIQLTVIFKVFKNNLINKRVVFFETDSVKIQCSLHIFDLKWNYISKIQFPVSSCCYFTSFKIITASEKSPLHLDWRFWKIYMYTYLSIQLSISIFSSIYLFSISQSLRKGYQAKLP